MQVNDALDAFLLGAFFFGLVMSGLAVALGVADASFDHFGHVGHPQPHHAGHGGSDLVQPLNIATILAFITWFGGVSYLLRNSVGLWAILSIPVGVAAGLVAAYIVFRLLRKLQSGERVLTAEDTRIEGVIGKVSSSIREGGTGEVIYEQRGIRQVSAARSQSGAPIARGEEVVILKRDHGVALVEPWESFLGDRHADLSSSSVRAIESQITRD
jgi:membrane protein implicated in regulation of membrane protease activity